MEQPTLPPCLEVQSALKQFPSYSINLKFINMVGLLKKRLPGRLTCNTLVCQGHHHTVHVPPSWRKGKGKRRGRGREEGEGEDSKGKGNKEEGEGEERKGKGKETCWKYPPSSVYIAAAPCSSQLTS